MVVNIDARQSFFIGLVLSTSVNEERDSIFRGLFKCRLKDVHFLAALHLLNCARPTLIPRDEWMFRFEHSYLTEHFGQV